MPGWWSGTYAGSRPIACGDVDADGELEYVIGGSFLSIFYNNGVLQRSIGPGPSTGYSYTYHSTASLADVNGDGKLEIGCFAYYSNGDKVFIGLHLFDLLLHEMPGYPIPYSFGVCTQGPEYSVAMADLDDDGDIELVLPSEACCTPTANPTRARGPRGSCGRTSGTMRPVRPGMTETGATGSFAATSTKTAESTCSTFWVCSRACTCAAQSRARRRWTSTTMERSYSRTVFTC
jgi:hypothetical protein